MMNLQADFEMILVIVASKTRKPNWKMEELLMIIRSKAEVVVSQDEMDRDEDGV